MDAIRLLVANGFLPVRNRPAVSAPVVAEPVVVSKARTAKGKAAKPPVQAAEPVVFSAPSSPYETALGGALAAFVARGLIPAPIPAAPVVVPACEPARESEPSPVVSNESDTKAKAKTKTNEDVIAGLGTVLANLARYGFAPSVEALAQLRALDVDGLTSFWQDVGPALKAETGDDRPMSRFVVYKNFPREVLDMSQARYWVNQILMYLGLPAEFLRQPEVQRPEISEALRLKVLRPSDEGTFAAILASLASMPARWTDAQRDHAMFLVEQAPHDNADVSAFAFRENGVRAVARAFTLGGQVVVPSATDVLRLAAALSDGDVGLRVPVRFRKFSRAERRRLLALLESRENLLDDVMLRPEPWKRLFALLHPGDFAVPRVKSAYDRLYRGDYESYGFHVEAGLRHGDVRVLSLMATRPGDFMRRLRKAYAVLGRPAVEAFTSVLPQLSVSQLVKLDGYLAAVNQRTTRIFAPRGNWTRAQFGTPLAIRFEADDLRVLREAVSRVVGARLDARFPDGVAVDPRLQSVTLQTNDQKLAAYGRGTTFPIPAEVNFVRSASYWAQKSAGPNWFDNSWNFFDADWKTVGEVCWNSTDTRGGGCVFSGDPVNSSDLKGRACQMIDLNLRELAASGVRYAVWSVLSFSRIPFAKAEDVLATLQWGENAEQGNLYEPARAQMVFPLKADALTSYVAFIDLEARRLVYMDANLYGNVHSAEDNGARLSERMPAFLEYLAALPSVADLFGHARSGTTPVLYDDVEAAVAGQAYVFRPSNPASAFAAIDLAAILDDKAA